jgi:hypothetical protein
MPRPDTEQSTSRYRRVRALDPHHLRLTQLRVRADELGGRRAQHDAARRSGSFHALRQTDLLADGRIAG